MQGNADVFFCMFTNSDPIFGIYDTAFSTIYLIFAPILANLDYFLSKCAILGLFELISYFGHFSLFFCLLFFKTLQLSSALE